VWPSQYSCLDGITLDEAICKQLTPQDLNDTRGLKGRLELLDKRDALLEHAALDRIRERRNEIAHELDNDATVEELSGACEIIQRQLFAWDLAEDRTPYTLEFNVSTRDSSDPNYAKEQHRCARVMDGDQEVAEIKQTVRFGRLSNK
jgi:hypothetical protein